MSLTPVIFRRQTCEGLKGVTVIIILKYDDEDHSQIRVAYFLYHLVRPDRRKVSVTATFNLIENGALS